MTDLAAFFVPTVGAAAAFLFLVLWYKNNWELDKPLQIFGGVLLAACIICIVVTKSNKIRRWFSRFSRQEEPKDSGDTMGMTSELYKELRRKHRGDKVYTTHANYSRPFVVYVSKQHATVYRRQHSDEWSNSDRKNYTQQVVQFPIHKCHVGKSPLTPTSRWSGGYGKAFDGNTLLLDLGNGTYAYVGAYVYTFSLMPGDTFHSYFSVVGPNDVPYPILRGHTHVYFMLDRTAVPLSKWAFAPNNTKEPLRTRWADAYKDYYTMNMETHSVPLQNVREIQ